MTTILSSGIEITDIEEKALKNDLIDIEQWMRDALTGKISNCKKRMIHEWLPRLAADPIVNSIPVNEDDLINVIVSHVDYKNRANRDANKKAI